MEEFHNESPDYKDDFIYSYGNAKQGKQFTFQLINFENSCWFHEPKPQWVVHARNFMWDTMKTCKTS